MKHRTALPYDGHTTLSYDPDGTYSLALLYQAANVDIAGCTLLTMTYTFNSRQRARLAELDFSGAENAKLVATISFKKRDYLPTIHQDLRDHLMRLMVYTITTKGYDMISDNKNKEKYTKLTAKIDVCELNQILKSTLRGVTTIDNSQVDEKFAEVILNLWGAQGFQRILRSTAQRYG